MSAVLDDILFFIFLEVMKVVRSCRYCGAKRIQLLPLIYLVVLDIRLGKNTLTAIASWIIKVTGAAINVR